MPVIRSADDDAVDVLARQDLPPVGHGLANPAAIEFVDLGGEIRPPPGETVAGGHEPHVVLGRDEVLPDVARAAAAHSDRGQGDPVARRVPPENARGHDGRCRGQSDRGLQEIPPADLEFAHGALLFTRIRASGRRTFGIPP